MADVLVEALLLFDSPRVLVLVLALLRVFGRGALLQLVLLVVVLLYFVEENVADEPDLDHGLSLLDHLPRDLFLARAVLFVFQVRLDNMLVEDHLLRNIEIIEAVYEVVQT